MSGRVSRSGLASIVAQFGAKNAKVERHPDRPGFLVSVQATDALDAEALLIAVHRYAEPLPVTVTVWPVRMEPSITCTLTFPKEWS